MTLRRFLHRPFFVPSRVAPKQSKASDQATLLHSRVQMQQAIGNQAVGRFFQPKLEVNDSRDVPEREADAIAELGALSPAANRVSASTPLVQRRKDEKLSLPGQTDRAAEPIVREVLHSPGQPLDPSTLAVVESRFGQDLSHVRVHRDERAAESASAVHARAYTVGQDVVFGAGQYAPETTKGRKLLTHELTHTIQQAQPQAGVNGDAEVQARSVGDRVATGQTVTPRMIGGAVHGLQAEKKDDTDEQPSKPFSLPGLKLTLDLLDKFEHNKATLTDEHKRRILMLSMQATEMIRQLGGATIKLIGHTDTSGDEKHNKQLGQQRADAVKTEFLLNMVKAGFGLNMFSIESESKGESDPIVKTGDNERNENNRRVEVQFQAPPSSFKLPPFPPAAPSGPTPLPPVPGGPTPTPNVVRPGPLPTVPIPSQEWLKDALEKDPLLRKLPDFARDKVIDALKDADEIAADKIIDALPWDDKEKAAAKAVVKSILQLLKGKKFQMPTPSPHQPPWGEMPGFPKMPGEKIFTLPPIRF